MTAPQITITPAGFAAIVNAEHTGTAPVRLSHVGLTAQHFDVATVGAAVPGEAKRLTTFGGVAVASDTLHLNVRDDTTDAYTLRGFGLYLQDGTLFAVYSQATPIMEKAAAATMLLATDIRFAKITATSIEVGDIDFVNPPASQTRAGVVRLSTDAEADAGSDASTALTPFGLARFINRRFGDGAPSAFVKGLLGLATAALFRTELGLRSAALREEGQGNGLDADLLDGNHGDYFLNWRNFTGVPSSFQPIAHSHSISDVQGLAASLDGKVDLSGDTMTGILRINTDGAGAVWFTDNVSKAYLRAGVNYTGAVADSGAWFLTTSGRYRFHDGVNSGKTYPVGEVEMGKVVLNNFRDSSPLQIKFTDGAAAYIHGNTAGGDDICSIVRAATNNYTLNWSGPLTSSSGGVSTKGAGAAINVYDRDFGDRYWSTYSTGTTMCWWLNAVGNLMSLSPSGALWTSGGYDSGSSRKLKDIEGRIPYGLAEVEQMEIVVGRYKPEYNADGRRRLFLVTENLAKLMPETVNEQGIEFNGELVGTLKLEQLLPVAFSAIQELSMIVRAQADEIAAIKEVR